MAEEKKLGGTTVRVETRDVTDIEVDAFVFYAVPDLKLGTGYGTAIQARGGPEIRKELEDLAPIAMGGAVVSSAGDMKAKHIIHAVGPQFVEEGREDKLREAMWSTLKCAEEMGMKTLAFPPMGVGFYMIPPETSSSIMLETIKAHVTNGTGLEEVTICVLDSTQQSTFSAALASV
jgi:O-acetyl-ADP-ribose deacetylase